MKSLRSIMRAAASKTALVLLLAAEMTLLADAHAGQPAAAPPASAEATTQVTTAAPARIQNAGQGLTKVALKKMTKAEIDKFYPALATITSLEKETWNEGDELPAFPATAYVADVRDKAANLNFLFVQVNDKTWCDKSSKLGCPYFVFVDQGHGYEQMMGFWVKGPLYLLRDGNKTSMILCSNKHNDEWALEGRELKFKSRDTSFKGVPACR